MNICTFTCGQEIIFFTIIQSSMANRHKRGEASHLRQTANANLYHLTKFPFAWHLLLIIATHELVV